MTCVNGSFSPIGVMVPTATDTVSGTVKTDVTEVDPVVYTKASVDALLAAIDGTAGALERPPLAVPVGESDEFDTATLNPAWTLTTTGAPVVDVDSSWRSHVHGYFDLANESARIERAVIGSPVDFSETAKFRFFMPTAGTNLHVGIYNTAGTEGVFCEIRQLGGSLNVQLVSRDAGVNTVRATVAVPLTILNMAAVHLQRISGTWSAWWSLDTWTFLSVGSHAKVLSADRLRVQLDQGAQVTPQHQACDWVRRDLMMLPG